MKSKRPVFIDWSLFLPLNDEHQGEGGTLVFVGVYITIEPNLLQGFQS